MRRRFTLPSAILSDSMNSLSDLKEIGLEIYEREDAIQRMNKFAAESVPFFFVVDYSRELALVMRTETKNR